MLIRLVRLSNYLISTYTIRVAVSVGTVAWIMFGAMINMVSDILMSCVNLISILHPANTVAMYKSRFVVFKKYFWRLILLLYFGYIFESLIYDKTESCNICMYILIRLTVRVVIILIVL